MELVAEAKGSSGVIQSGGYLILLQDQDIFGMHQSMTINKHVPLFAPCHILPNIVNLSELF